MDYAATTPVDERVAERMMAFLTREGDYGNPASTAHSIGWTAADAVEQAREQVAEAVGASDREIIWTSGATESNNLAIKGAAHFYAKRGRHLVSCKTEHKAVLDTLRQLEREGFEVTYLSPDANGLITVEQVADALREDTLLLSLMHVNNETGVIQDIASIGQLCRERGVLFHVDAAQSAGKLPLKLDEMAVDLMSFSAHKLYGPKGIGALYVQRRPRVRLEALIHGGGHERGLRSGTLPTHQIVGMGEAFSRAEADRESEQQRLLRLRERLWQGLQDLPAVTLNGHLEQRVANHLNVSFSGVEGDSLLLALRDVAVSSGSACTSATLEPSYVLTAMGRDHLLAHSAVRFSLGRYSTENEVDRAIEIVKKGVTHLREMSPLWDARDG
ncbi:cysteine desulfurase [gamma proteobacterium HTCC5015]|nr:cysteine desulfurase [gamma proteobacterium HTCC5015]